MLSTSLHGINVLDFSQIAAGPTCSMALADMGADVVKVEPPGGDPGRGLGPGWVGADSALFHALNRNKRGICLDLKRPEGLALALRLAARADVLIESMRPGVMQRLGLDGETVRQSNPGLVYCSISAYGQHGPYAGAAGVDGVLQADTGLMSLIGLPGMEPCKVQVPVVDVMTGHMACSAILAGLVRRGRDGLGSYLDVNLMNCAVGLQTTSLASYLSDGALPAPIGSAAPYAAPNEAFQAADGWIMVAAYLGDRWPRLCALLGHPEWIADPRFETSQARVAHRAEMRHLLNGVFGRHPVAHWLSLLREHDILCARVATYDDLVAHPQLTSNSMLVEVEVPGHGKLRLPGMAVNSGESVARTYTPAPALGQHSRQILEGLGLSGDQIDRLIAEAAVA